MKWQNEKCNPTIHSMLLQFTFVTFISRMLIKVRRLSERLRKKLTDYHLPYKHLPIIPVNEETLNYICCYYLMMNTLKILGL